MGNLSIGLAAIFLSLALAGCTGAVLPPVSEPVTDLTALLDDATERALTSEIRALQEQTGVEVAVVVTSTARWSLQRSAARLFKEWSAAARRSERGVLIVVAPQKYAGSIHVGHALEPILPDGLTWRVWDQSFQPYFQSGQHQTGVSEGVAEVVRLLRAGHVVTSDERAALDAEANPRMPRWITWATIGPFIAIGAWLVGAGIKSGDRRAMVVGGAMLGPALLASWAPITNLPLALAVPLVLAMLVVGYRTADPNRPVLRSQQRKRRPRRG